MKNLLFVLLGSLLLLSGYSPLAKEEYPESKHMATCYGNKNCYACKNCKYCAYCNSGGGSCGICSSSASLPTKSAPQKIAVEKSTGSANSSSSSQCKGTTKKGQRCKRMVKGGGYCWQHG